MRLLASPQVGWGVGALLTLEIFEADAAEGSEPTGRFTLVGSDYDRALMLARGHGNGGRVQAGDVVPERETE